MGNTVNPLLELIALRKEGIPAGIPSYCTANELVIEAVLEQAKRFGEAGGLLGRQFAKRSMARLAFKPGEEIVAGAGCGQSVNAV